ncbi:MAG TPA: C13 family peptidase [Noviherbaspirillum sp.]|nr:C13 family peptidase [Noviherbaspirillum sp.]
MLDTTGLSLLWLLPSVWTLLAQFTLLLRNGVQRPSALLGASLALLAATVLYYVAPPAEFWYPAEQTEKQTQRRQLHLTQELMEAQPRLLTQRLDGIAPQRPGIIDLYALTFSPYATADVFRRESGMVADVMAQRFDANGRTLQLINHIDTPAEWPWATPLNLQRAIRHLATVMDRDEDILFIHLTSHGARDGELAAGFWPLTVNSVRPAALKQWLDEAGIKYRVLSISACYSGSWITPLANDNTLVMTAADADHTSYGCGRLSELTFFGRAIYDEQLRNNTLSFEEAHAAARSVIKTREEEAGKDDGYSNPQISIGGDAKNHLARLRERLHAQH